ncbi:MAG: cellulose synthase operon protein [Chloroflexota bacterium]|nr:cellulose synthase operon protein [Chloroflexota bacterium]
MKSKAFRLVSLLIILTLTIFAPVQASGLEQAGGGSLTLSLSELDFSGSLNLRGPYQEVNAAFGLPADWSLNAPVQFDLRFRSDFASLMQAFAGTPESADSTGIRGSLSVYLNDTLLQSLEVDTSTENTLSFEVPAGQVLPYPADNELRIAWDAAAACALGVTSGAYLDPASTMQFSYATQAVDLSLRDFPRPFFSTTDIQPHALTLLIPSEADESSLSALLAVAAGLGRHSRGELVFNVMTSDQISTDELADTNLVLIGPLESWRSYLAGSGQAADTLQAPAGVGSEDGLLMLLPSPWNSGRALLLVSGQDAAGLQKASASLAAADFLPYADGRTAVISQLERGATQALIDLRLDSLRTDENLLVEQLGDTTFTIPFNMPADVNISPEAYVEVYFRHSQLIDYLQSSLTIRINGTKIGSIRFSDQSAENGLARIILPPGIIQPLQNTLEITTSIVPQDLCADERSGNFWVSVLGDSYLHLPPVLDSGGGGAADLYLADFPQALLTDERLSSLTFVAAADDWQSWLYAADLVYRLGGFTASDQLQPSAAFLDSAMDDLSGQSILLIGTTQAIGASAWNDALPLPFEADGALPALSFEGVQFSIAGSQDLGVLQITRQSGSGTPLFSLAGSSAQGLRAAVTAAQQGLSEKLSADANLSVIDGQQVGHELLIEKPAGAPAEEASSSKWYQRLLGQNMEKADFYLLAGSVVLTALYILWMATSKPKRK